MRLTPTYDQVSKPLILNYIIVPFNVERLINSFAIYLPLGLGLGRNSHLWLHYSDVITSAMASQIAGVSIVYSTVCSGADDRKHQTSASLAFVRGIHRCFHLMTSSCDPTTHCSCMHLQYIFGMAISHAVSSRLCLTPLQTTLQLPRQECLAVERNRWADNFEFL